MNESSTIDVDAADGVTLAYDILSSSTEYVDISTDYGQYYDDLKHSSNEVKTSMLECASHMNDHQLLPDSKRKKFKECLDIIRQRLVPRIIGRRPCIKQYTYYSVDPMKLPMYGEVTRCPDGEKCTK